MSISGNLTTMELADLLLWASDRRKTGALVIDGGRVEKKVYFDRGKVVASASTDPKEFLSHLLLSYGLMAEHRLAQVMDKVEESNQLLGRYLADHEGIAVDELTDLLVLKTKESIFDLFGWEQGEFHFVDGAKLGENPVAFEIGVAELIDEGRERQEHWQAIRRIIPNGRAIPVAIGFVDDPTRDKHERNIVKLIDDSRSVYEISVESRTSEYYVCQVMMSLIEKGRLKMVLPPEGDGFRPDSKAGLSTGITVLDSDNLIQAAKRHLEDKSYEKSMRYLKAARSLEPDNQKVKQQVQEAEREIEAVLEGAGITSDAVPKLNRPIDELAQLQLTPEAGFLLTRIDGSYDLGSIMKITPLPTLEARVLVFRLIEDDHIRLERRA